MICLTAWPGTELNAFKFHLKICQQGPYQQCGTSHSKEGLQVLTDGCDIGYQPTIKLVCQDFKSGHEWLALGCSDLRLKMSVGHGHGGHSLPFLEFHFQYVKYWCFAGQATTTKSQYLTSWEWGSTINYLTNVIPPCPLLRPPCLDRTHLWTWPLFWSQIHTCKVLWQHSARLLCYHGDKLCLEINKTDGQSTGKALKTASVVVSATVGVYRMWFSHDDTHIQPHKGKNNSSHAVAANKNRVNYSLVAS